MVRESAEMTKLAVLLASNGIQFETVMIKQPKSIFDTELVSYAQLIIKDGYSNWICDAICHPGSYGFEDGMLEIMAHNGYENSVLRGETEDTVVGWLTAEEALEYFKRGWEAHREKTEDSVES